MIHFDEFDFSGIKKKLRTLKHEQIIGWETVKVKEDVYFFLMWEDDMWEADK